MQTLRRLNDPERYYGLSWRGWLGVAIGGGALYGAVRVSPFGARTTVTLVVLASAFCGVAIAAISGQALSPARHLLALVRYTRAPKRYAPPRQPDRRGGLVLDSPPMLAEPPGELALDGSPG